MMDYIYDLENKDDKDLCLQILAIAATVYRPITLRELRSLIPPVEGFNDDPKRWEGIIQECGSFLNLQEGVVYFVHQSAKEFLLEKASNSIFLSNVEHQHYGLFSRSLSVMSTKLKRNVYKLKSPGTLIEEVTPPNPDPLGDIRYCCLYWFDHLLHSGMAESNGDLMCDGSIHTFLKGGLLYWLESLSLLHGMPKGVEAIEALAKQVVSFYHSIIKV